MHAFVHCLYSNSNKPSNIAGCCKETKQNDKNVVWYNMLFFLHKNLFYFIYLHLLAVYEFREDAIFVIQSKSVINGRFSFFLFLNGKQRAIALKKNKLFITYKSWINTSLMKICCLLKQLLNVFWKKKTRLKTSCFILKMQNGGKRLTLWCHISQLWVLD